MSSVSQSQPRQAGESTQLLRGLRNPVLRTYLFPKDFSNWRRYFLQLAAWLGLLMLALGPLSGQLIIPRILKQEAARHQLIAPDMDCHKPSKSSQLCPHSMKISYSLFNVTNPDDFMSGVEPPALDVVGPFAFEAAVFNWNVSYSGDRELVRKTATLRLSYLQESSCRECEAYLDLDLHVINKDALRSPLGRSSLLFHGTVRSVLKAMAMGSYRLNYTHVASDGNLLDMLGSSSHGRELAVDTGYRNWNQTSSAVALDFSGRREMLGRDAGQVFGFDVNSAEQVIFDRWLAESVSLKSTGLNPHVRGLETQELGLNIGSICSGKFCIKHSWNATHQFGVPTIVTLPFFKGLDPEHRPEWMLRATENQENQHWKFHVDPVYGFTIDSQSTYQVNHFVPKDADFPIWVPNGASRVLIPSHWMQVQYNISESDLNFIKALHSRAKLGFYVCTVVLTVIGSSALAISVYQLFFSKPAKIRSKTMQILLRSRARDPMLNPAQYTALRHFMVGQMKKPPRTCGTDEVDAKQDSKSKKGKPSRGSSGSTGK